MKEKIIFIVLVIYGFAIGILLFKPIKQDSVNFFLQASDKLKTNYLDGTVYCDEQNFGHRGEYIYCMNEYITKHTPQDFQNYKRIKQFCRIIKDNECDIDNCITDVIIKGQI